MSSAAAARDFDIACSLDCRGKRCPMPIYMASKTLASMSAGEVLEVKCTDAGSAADFPGFADRAGHTLLAAERGEDRVHVFYLRRADD
jgi:tRNA 2-thiouridine synthesizing protein A